MSVVKINNLEYGNAAIGDSRSLMRKQLNHKDLVAPSDNLDTSEMVSFSIEAMQPSVADTLMTYLEDNEGEYIEVRAEIHDRLYMGFVASLERTRGKETHVVSFDLLAQQVIPI